VRFLGPHHDDGDEYEDGEDEEEKEGVVEDGEGEEAVMRKLGGFERFFGTYQSMGLGLIFMVADVEGPVDVEVGGVFDRWMDG
jgi:hypothetical protein